MYQIMYKYANLSRVMRKSFFLICADQRLCFPTWIVHSSTSVIRNFKPLTIFCDCTARFVSDLVGNIEDGCSRDTAHLKQPLTDFVVYTHGTSCEHLRIHKTLYFRQDSDSVLSLLISVLDKIQCCWYL